MQQLLGHDAETPLWTWISKSEAPDCLVPWQQKQGMLPVLPWTSKCCQLLLFMHWKPNAIFSLVSFPVFPHGAIPASWGWIQLCPVLCPQVHGGWNQWHGSDMGHGASLHPAPPWLQFSVGKMHLSLIMSAFPHQAAWCVGCCLLSKSFWDICSCSACSDFAGTKIITERTGGKKVWMHTYAF